MRSLVQFVVAHIYNPSNSGSRDWGIKFQCQPGQRVRETPPISTNKPDVVTCASPLSYTEDVGKRFAVWSRPQEKNVRLYLKNN
jgi:hypothetical protein